MKVLVGIVIALTLSLGFTLWRLDSSRAEITETRLALAETSAALSSATKANQYLENRLTAFVDALGRLQHTLTTNQSELTNRLADIKNISEEPTDDPESFACLDLPVPVQLDRRLREPEATNR